MKKNCSFRVIRMDERSEADDLLNRSPKIGIPKSIFNALASRFQSYVKHPGSIELERPIGHPDLEELLTAAKQLGAIIQKDRSDVPAQVLIRDYDVYTQEEKCSALFLECECHQPRYDAVDTAISEGSLGIRYLLSKDRGGGESFTAGACGNLFHLIAVRGDSRKRLVDANLKGLKLVQMMTDAPGGGWGKIEPLHLLWSDYRLPPVDLPVFDNKYNIFQPEGRPETIERGCFLLDGFRINPQLRYKNIEDKAFDIGRTYERFGGGQECYHKLVFSQRARGVLEEIGLLLELRPVVVR